MQGRHAHVTADTTLFLVLNVARYLVHDGRKSSLSPLVQFPMSNIKT